MIRKVVSPILVIGFILIGSVSTEAYTVKKGDTLGEIAKDNGTTVHKLSKLNPQIKDVNLIFIGENIDVDVGAEDSTKSKDKKKDNKDVPVKKAVKTNQSELDLFAQLVHAESRGESYKGKVAVAEVVMNRVESKQFPNSVKDVIYQKGQFSPITDGSINNKPSEDAYKAVKEAMQGTNLTDGALYFWHPEIATNKWLNTKTTTTKIGVHEFKK